METEFSASRRGRVIERINQRLQALDYQTLLKLDELTERVEADRERLVELIGREASGFHVRSLSMVPQTRAIEL